MAEKKEKKEPEEDVRLLAQVLKRRRPKKEGKRPTGA